METCCDADGRLITRSKVRNGKTSSRAINSSSDNDYPNIARFFCGQLDGTLAGLDFDSGQMERSSSMQAR